MTRHLRKLMTIVTESALERRIVQEIEMLGAHGWTVSDARGKGKRGIRNSTWDGSSNIRIDIVCNEETATLIARHLQEMYYNDYAMILFVADVVVMRPEKF